MHHLQFSSHNIRNYYYYYYYYCHCHYYIDTKDITILSEVKNKMQVHIHFFWGVILCQWLYSF